jgi:beta-lactam-binding protein with PASTA domain
LLEGTLTQRRENSQTTPVDPTLIRSWLAIVLVSGLLLFGALSFTLDASELRNLLMGGVIASAGTATAFYFASKESENTQRNLLNAVFGATTKVPNVAGITVGDARRIMQAVGLTFETNPAAATDSQTVTDTQPTAGTPIQPGAEVAATVTPASTAAAAPIQVPDVIGKNVADARTTVEGLGLTFETNPAAATDSQTVTDTQPTAGTPIQPGAKVTAIVSGI